MTNSDLKSLLKRVVELVMPNLRQYYRVVRKAKVVKTYASDGKYWADVQPLRNDESVDESEPVIPRVEIPVIWGGAKRGIICPPAAGTLCDLSYYDGDPNYPRISNFRWFQNEAPEVEIGAFIIQKEPGVFIKIDAEKNIICETPTNRNEEIGEKWTVSIGGDADLTVEGKTTLHSKATVEINGGGDDPTGVVTQKCVCAFTGKPHSDYSADVTASRG